MRYSADKYDFCVCSQEQDGELLPPKGSGWLLIAVNTAEGEDVAIVIGTWARLKPATPEAPECPDS